MKTEPNKVECRECYWRGQRSELLAAPDPFCPGDNCFGCPKCKSIDCFLPLCDEPGCSNSATCGTPTPDGYRSTCHHHVPRNATGSIVLTCSEDRFKKDDSVATNCQSTP